MLYLGKEVRFVARIRVVYDGYWEGLSDFAGGEGFTFIEELLFLGGGNVVIVDGI